MGFDFNALTKLTEFTDLHMPVNNPGDRTMLFSQAHPQRRLSSDHPELAPILAYIAEKMRELGREANGASFRFELPDSSLQWRCQEIRSDLYALRSTRTKPPEFGKEVKLPDYIEGQLLNEGHQKKGGLIILSGIPGSGKTWTAIAMIKRMLELYGGYCLTIEDPIEIKMEGMHGNKSGLIEQMDASKIGYQRAITNSLRCFPANMRAMLFLGEIRDPNSAAEVLRISMGGHLVITTMHADSHASACQRLVSLAQDGGEPDAKRLLSTSLRVLINQRLEGGRLQASMLINPDGGPQVRDMIARGDYSQFGTVIQQQNKAGMISNQQQSVARPGTLPPAPRPSF